MKMGPLSSTSVPILPLNSEVKKVSGIHVKVCLEVLNLKPTNSYDDESCISLRGTTPSLFVLHRLRLCSIAMPPKSAPVALQQIITNSEAESVLTSSGYYKCLRNRKRTLDQLQPQYASRLRYKAAKILEGWCQDGVPSNDIWGYLQNSTDLISKFSLKPLPLNHPAIESEVLHHELV